MKLKFLLAASVTFIFLNAQAQVWQSYDWFNNPPQPSPTISSLAFFGDTTWIGTVQYGLGWSTDDTTWHVVDTANSDLPDNWISTLQKDNTGNLWVGTGYEGLAKYDGSTWTVYNSTNTPLLPNVSVNAVAVDPSNNIWVGYMLGGVAKFDGTNWTTYTTADGLPHNTVRGIASESNGNIWIATSQGAAMFNGVTWTTYNMSNTTLVNDDFMAVAIDSADHLWFGTTGGAAKFDGTTWTSYTPLNTLAFNEPVNALAFDAAGNVWFASMLAGIIKFDGTTFTEYNMANTTPTLPSNEFLVALTNPCSNDVYFGSNSGLAIYNDLTTPECTQDTTATFVNDLVGNDFSISALQNPSGNGLVELVCNVTAFGDYQIVLTDMLGREIYSNAMSLNSGATILPLQLSDNGFYIATLRNNISASTAKLILK